MHSEQPKDPFEGDKYTGEDILYREGAVGFFDVQRAADALLRQGRKPSVAGIREQLGGGSPNTITPLLAKYWQKLGERLVEGPDSLERVPEALARVTELLWRRALEEARERLKLLQQPDQKPGAVEELQEQIGKLSVALAEARAREGEMVTHISELSKSRDELHGEKRSLVALLTGMKQLLGERAGQKSRTDIPRKMSRRRKRRVALRVETSSRKGAPQSARRKRKVKRKG